MRRLVLRPTQDAVFKMMFTQGPDAQEALIGLLTAVLRPASPIAEISVENPDILPDGPGRKRVVLDINVRFEDGTRCVVEMQTKREAALPERLLVYGARTYGGQLAEGAPYGAIQPVYVIVFLAYDDPRFPRFHATYRMREDHAPHGELSSTLVTHVVSLTRWKAAARALRRTEAKLLDWAKLLSADTLEGATEAAGDDPAMTKAAAALDRLQDDPKVRELARSIDMATEWHKIELAAQREEGREEGRQALRDTVVGLLAARGLALSASLRASLDACRDLATLERWVLQAAVASAADEALR